MFEELKKAGFSDREITEYRIAHPEVHQTPGYTGSWSPIDPPEIDQALKVAATFDVEPAAAFLGRDLFQKKVKETGYATTTGRSVVRGMGHVYSGVADALDWMDLIPKEYSNIYREFGKKLQFAYDIPVDPTEFTFKKMLDPTWLATSLASGVPFTLSLIPAALIGMYGGGILSGTLGFGAFGKVILASIGARALTRPIEAAIEAGGTHRKVLAETGDEERANKAGNNTFELNLAWTGVDAAETALAFTPLRYFGKTASRTLIRRVLATVGKLALTGALETTEEWYQDVVQEVSDDLSWDAIKEEITKLPPERQEAMSIGMVMGVGLGGTGSVYTELKNRVVKSMPEAVAKIYEEALKETTTELEALDRLAETPEGEKHIDNVIKEMKGEEVEVPTEEVIPEKDTKAKIEKPKSMPIEDITTAEQLTLEAARGVLSAEEVVALEDAEVMSDADVQKKYPGEEIKWLHKMGQDINLTEPITKEDKLYAQLLKEKVSEFVETTPGKFKQGMISSGKKAFLTDYTIDELGKFTLYTSHGGKVGFALTPTKDMVSVFNNSEIKGAGQEAVIKAIVEGAKTTDCFEGFLSRYYRSFGFKVVKKVKWDEKYAPEGWNYELYGKPDVVYLEYEGSRAPETIRAFREKWLKQATEVKIKAKGAALRFPNGDTITAQTHAVAYQKALNKGWEKRLDEGFEEGFVDTNDKFLTRDEANELYGANETNALLKKKVIETKVEAKTDIAAILLEKPDDIQLAILDKEIEIIMKQLGKKIKPKYKKIIRESTGILKVSNVLCFEERAVLKDQIRFEARAARKAFSEGRKEAALRHKEHQKELVLRARERTRLRERLNKIKKDLKALKPEKMMPQFGEPIQQILDGIDLAKPITKTLIKLAARKDFLERNPGYVDMPDKYIEELNRLEKIPIRDMTVDDVENLYSAIMLYEKLNKTFKTIKVGQRERLREEVLDESISLMKTQKKVKKDFVDSQITPASVGMPQIIKDFFGLHQRHYNTVLEILFGINTVPYKVLWTGVKKGVIKKLNILQQAEDMLNYDAFQKKHNIKDMLAWKNEYMHPEKGMRLTRDERASLWRHAQHPDNLKHILEGGIGFKQTERQLDVTKVTEEALNATLDSMDKAELEYAQFPEKIKYFDWLFKQEAEVYLDVNMFPMKKIEGLYHPIDVMPSELESLDKGNEPVILKDHIIKIGIKKGQLVKRIKANKPIYLNSLTCDLATTKKDAAFYVGLEKPLIEASKLLYDKKFKNQLSKRYDNGLEIWKNIEKALKDIAGQNQGHGKMGRGLLKVKSQLTTAILGFNPFTWAIQIPSSVLYMTYVKPEYYFQGLIDAFNDPKGVRDKHVRYDSEFRARIEGGYSRDVMDAIAALKGDPAIKGKSIREWSMWGLKAADQVATVPGMQGAVLQALAEFEVGKMGTSVKMALDMTDAEIATKGAEEKLSLAYDFARWCTERTQPMFAPEHRSALSRGAAPYQMLTMFGAYVSGARNLVERAYVHYQRVKTQESLNTLAMSLFGVFVLNTLAMMARDDLKNFLLKRREEPWNVSRILKSWTSYVFGLRDLAYSLINKMERGTFMGKDPELPIMRIPELMTDVTAHGLGMLTETGRKQEKATEKFVDGAIESVLLWYGMPWRAPKAMIEAPFKERPRGKKK